VISWETVRQPGVFPPLWALGQASASLAPAYRVAISRSSPLTPVRYLPELHEMATSVSNAKLVWYLTISAAPTGRPSQSAYNPRRQKLMLSAVVVACHQVVTIVCC